MDDAVSRCGERYFSVVRIPEDAEAAAQDTLVYSKPGKLYVWALASNGHSPIFRTIALHTQHVSVGSSALTPVVGLEYVTSEDTLVVALTDGSFHTVLHFSGTRTTAEPPAEPGLSGLRLSKTARATFAAAEPENTTTRDVNRHYGMVSYDGFSWFAWLHEYVVVSLVSATQSLTIVPDHVALLTSATNTTLAILVCLLSRSCGMRSGRLAS